MQLIVPKLFFGVTFVYIYKGKCHVKVKTFKNKDF